MEKIGLISTDEFPGLLYDPETGWLIRDGKRAGCQQNKGYWITSIKGKQIVDHRIIWFMMTGAWPSKQIDHINGIRDDNRWCNLREVSNQQNQFNRAVRKDSSTGIKGVYPKGNKFRASIFFNWKEKHLGYFDTVEEAKAAYEKAALELQGDFRRKDES